MKAYFARIPMTGLFVRVPRWLYNRWPWAGVVEMSPNSEVSDAVGRNTGSENKP